MDTFNHMKIKSKLSLLVGLFVLGFMAFGIVTYSTMNTLRATLDNLKVNGPKYKEIVQSKDLIADILPPPEYILEAYMVVLQMADETNRAGLSTRLPGERESLIEKSVRLRKEYFDRHNFWMTDLQSLPPSADKLKTTMLDDSYLPAKDFLDVRDTQFIPAVQRGDYKTAKALAYGVLRQKYNAHRAAIDKVVAMANARNAELERGAKVDINAAESVIAARINTLITLGVAIIAIVALGVGWFLSRSISNTLNETASALSATSTEIASTIEQHERTAMHQSAAVNETTTTMDELDASFNQTAEMVKTAADTARQAVSVADNGIRTVQQTLDGMLSLKDKVGIIAEQILSLSEQTSQISTITNLVSDLANQTNMLALNAAVEAARAGEHGKGFGVVAAEIRKLADESKKSAERINALVEDIQKATNSTVMATEEGTKTVEQGIMLAQETVTAFNGVTASSNTASDAAQQTLLSVPQQVTAVKQVLSSMDSLNKGAKETADGLSQTRVSVENLREAALRLKRMI
ncbi:MAG: methyl-accepting chemotaxis protein [Abitibacteriaceae bacterium]|nr:methyl-accepting chemotaxis protein [Abditibacteriaceae bacterium]